MDACCFIKKYRILFNWLLIKLCSLEFRTRLNVFVILVNLSFSVGYLLKFMKYISCYIGCFMIVNSEEPDEMSHSKLGNVL